MDDEIKVQNLTKFYTLVLLKSNNLVTGYYILKRLGIDLGKTASPTYVYAFLNKLKKMDLSNLYEIQSQSAQEVINLRLQERNLSKEPFHDSTI